MARYSNVQTNFAGGLVSDYILGRTDIDRVANSSRKFTNFLPTVQGPADYRKGFKYLNKLTDVNEEKSVSTTVTLSTDNEFRVVFSEQKIKIYDENGVKKGSDIASPYPASQLDNLRFSSETDELYICHPLYTPRLLYPTTSLIAYRLTSQNGDDLFSGDGTTAEDPLFGNIEIEDANSWVFQELSFTVEPLLEPYNGNETFKITNNESYIKLTSTENTYAPIVTASADLTVAHTTDVDDAQDDIVLTLPTGHGLLVGDQISITGSSNAQLNTTHTLTAVTSTTVTFVVSGYGARTTTDIAVDRKVVATRYYVQYELNGEQYLGKVVIAATSSNYTLADPDNKVIYVSPVSSTVDIEDPEARLFLLDNLETSSAADIALLAKDGVPDNSIHLRSDTTVFNQGLVGSWVLVDDTRRAKDIIVGQNRTTKRWVQIKEHRGTEDHPINFIRGAYDNTQYTAGSVYKIFNSITENSGTLYQVGPSNTGTIGTTTAVVTDTGNRTYTFVNGLSTDAASLTLPTGDYTIGNLSTQKQFDVVDCEPVIVEEYTASNTDGTLMVPSATATVTIDVIANDVQLIATGNIFSSTDVGRQYQLELVTGNVFGKGVRYVSPTKLILELSNAIPRDKRTLDIENGGDLLSVSFGAWYAGNYPRTVTKFEQRRVFGGTFKNPNLMFFTRATDEASFQPTQDDKEVLDTDGITYSLSNQTAAVTWLDSLKDLVIGTSGGIYRVVPNQYLYGVSPKTIRIELTQEEPCNAQAISVGSSIFYPDQSGGRLLEYKYDINIQNSASNDISKLIYPTFTSNSIKKIAFQHSPQPRIWVLTKNGELYCLVYHRQEEFYAWSKMDFNSHIDEGFTKNHFVKDISVIRKGSADKPDSLFIIIKRGSNVYTEVFNEAETENTAGFSADHHHTYLDSYVTNSAGLGVAPSKDFSSRFSQYEKVDVTVDGVYKGRFTISPDGTPYGLTVSPLDDSVTAGLAYTGELQPMFPTWDGQNKPAYGAETQRVVSVKPFLINTLSYSVGIGDAMTETDVRTDKTKYGTSALYTGFDKEKPVSGSLFGVDNLPTFKQTKPYPMTIASLITKSDLN